MIIDGRYKASYVGVPCGTKFLRLFIFADWAFCYEARVWRDCDQRWRDSTPFKFCDYINSSLVCQILLIAGLNIRSIKLLNYQHK